MINIMIFQANAAVTILESTSTDDEAEAMVKISDLTVNSVTGIFDSEFPTDESMLSSTMMYDDNRRLTRTQQFFHDAGVKLTSFQQQRIPVEKDVKSYEAPVSVAQTNNSSSSIPSAVHFGSEEIVVSQPTDHSFVDNLTYVQSTSHVGNATTSTSTSEQIIQEYVVTDEVEPSQNPNTAAQYDANVDLQDTQLTLVSMGSLNQLLQLIQTMQQKQDAFQGTVIAHIAALNAKMDAIANRCVVAEDLFSPVNSAEEMDDLEVKAKNPDFHRNVVLRLGNTVGKGTPGGTAALLLIHKFFDKTFLLSCSWSGKARGESKTKIGLIRFPSIVNLFVETVQYCDSSYSAPQCQSFLKTRLKNAKQNCSLKNVRSTACRPNRKRKIDSVPQLTDDATDEAFDDDEDENGENGENGNVSTEDGDVLNDGDTSMTENRSSSNE